MPTWKMWSVSTTACIKEDVEIRSFFDLHTCAPLRVCFVVTVMDARNMNYIPSDCFDCVIDKALFDALLCSETNTADVQAYLEEVHRVIKPGGVFVLISHGAPASRMPHFQLSMAQTQGVYVASNSGNTPASGSVQGQPLGGGCKWSIDHHEIRKFFYSTYVCTRVNTCLIWDLLLPYDLNYIYIYMCVCMCINMHIYTARPFLRAPAQSDGPVPTSPFHVYACRKTE
jgi:SAM-dependent methyltransferase